MDVPLKKASSGKRPKKKRFQGNIYRKKSLSERGTISFENVSPNKNSSAKKLPSVHKISETYENDVYVEFQVSQKAYDRINAKIADVNESLANASMKKATAEEKIIDGTVSSVVVSGDGTWKTREHTSLIGVCTLIGADCRKVLDMEIMTSYCKGCDSYKGSKFGPKYGAFIAKHHTFCRKNHSRSAGGMKVCGMQKIFFRLEQKHGLVLVTQRHFRLLLKKTHVGIVFPLKNRVCEPWSKSEWVAACGS
ncbi:uncharacterized protein TNCV_3528891 [Trichonephila clavipes]|nr:uncharacterized protein TNCV_3528891 [Trichonephila clavipes]